MVEQKTILYRNSWLLTALLISIVSSIFSPILSDPPSYEPINLPGLDYSVTDFPAAYSWAEFFWNGEWYRVYENAGNQFAPLHLLLSSLVGKFAIVLVGSPLGWQIVRAIVVLVFLLLAGFLISFLLKENSFFKNLSKSSQDIRFFWATNITVLSLGILVVPLSIYGWGHWSQPIVVGLWIIAGLLLSGKHYIVAGILLGLSVGFEPWGIFGILLVFIFGKSWRDKIVATILGVSLGVAWWAPFILYSDFGTAEIAWWVRGDSLWSVFEITNFSWTQRIIQATLVAGGTMLVAFFYKKKRKEFTALSIIGFPLVILLLRISTDPIYYPYYGSTVLLFLIPLVISVLFTGAKDYKLLIALGLATYFCSLIDLNWAAEACLLDDRFCETPHMVDTPILSPYLFAIITVVGIISALFLEKQNKILEKV